MLFTSKQGATYVKMSFIGKKKNPKHDFGLKCVLSRHIPFTYFAASFKNLLGDLRRNKSILLLVRRMVHMAKTDADQSYSITEYSELKQTHKDHQVQLLGEWPAQGSNPQPWCY